MIRTVSSSIVTQVYATSGDRRMLSLVYILIFINCPNYHFIISDPSANCIFFNRDMSLSKYMTLFNKVLKESHRRAKMTFSVD